MHTCHLCCVICAKTVHVKCCVRQVYLSTHPSIAREFTFRQAKKSISELKKTTVLQSRMRIAKKSNFCSTSNRRAVPTELTRTSVLDSSTGFRVTSRGRSSILFGHRFDNHILEVLRIVGFFVVLIVVQDERVYFFPEVSFTSASSQHAHFYVGASNLLRAVFGEHKTRWPSSQASCLGVHVRLEEVGSNRDTFELVAGTLECLAQEAQAHLSQGTCMSAQAAKLRGRAGWAVTVVFARAARRALAPMKWRQYQNCHHAHLTPGLAETFTFLITVMPCIPPRLFEATQPVRKPILAYNDASWPDPAEEETNPPRLGWLFLEPGDAKAFTAKLTNQVVSRWLPRKQQIMCAEALAPRTALHHSAARLNIMVRGQSGCGEQSDPGSARPEEVGRIASMQATLAAQLSTQVWYEWVDSAPNPSDGLSRVGVDCPLCKRNGWPVPEIVWDSLYSQYGRMYLLTVFFFFFKKKSRFTSPFAVMRRVSLR